LGEWYWGVNADHSTMKQEEKVGIWKCPYHNSRACMEIIHRIENIFKEKKMKNMNDLLLIWLVSIFSSSFNFSFG
jgi:hypothetical protein